MTVLKVIDTSKIKAFHIWIYTRYIQPTHLLCKHAGIVISLNVKVNTSTCELVLKTWFCTDFSSSSVGDMKILLAQFCAV